MNSLVVIDAFRIPEGLKVSTRVIGRTVFRQNASLSPADARIIESSMTDLKVVATIRPAEFMIPAYVDDIREYLEILLVRATVKAESAAEKLAGMLHRAMPYPVVAVLDMPGDAVHLSVAHKRNPVNNLGRMVIESMNSVVLSGRDGSGGPERAFLASLDVSRLPVRNLFVTYQAIWDRITAMRAASVVNVFGIPADPDQAALLEKTLSEYLELTAQADALRSRAERETQMNRRVEYNDQISKLGQRQIAAVLKMQAIMAAGVER